MKNQFEYLQDWTIEILEDIKKDIKSDHLNKAPVFYRAYFGNRPQNRLTSEEIFTAYEKELLKGNEELAEWIVNRWVFKHADLYQHFADRLSRINPRFSEIEHLTLEQSEEVLRGAEELFGAIPTFLLSVLNGVVFPQSILERLHREAERERVLREQQKKEEGERQSVEKITAAHQREVARLHEKLSAMEKKYAKDTEDLKKQIKTLQQKVWTNSSCAKP